jgi:hypothetical protein
MFKDWLSKSNTMLSALEVKERKTPLANVDNKVQWYVNVFSL